MTKSCHRFPNFWGADAEASPGNQHHRAGNMVMKHLQALDPIAYIRFACVYKRFKNIDELMEAIQSIKPKDGNNC